jgi:hypothetical protein
VLGVQLGNSFWSVGAANDTGRYVKTDAMPDFSDGHPFLLWLEARIKTGSGREIVVTSDGQWTWDGGPLTFSHIYAGEDFDARAAHIGWNAPGYDAHDWRPVKIVQPPGAALARFDGPPIKEFEVFRPTSIMAPRSGEYTYVFSQNCSALVSCRTARTG